MAEGEHCQSCGETYSLIYRVPDALWERITGRADGSGLYCIRCLDGLAVTMGISLYWDGAAGNFPTERPKTTLAFPVVEPGEWVQPVRRGYRLQCCDCGLMHRLNFRLIRYAGGTRHTIQFQAFREDHDQE